MKNHILIAEKNTIFSEAMSSALKKRGFSVVQCEKNGGKLISAVLAGGVSAVISDIFLSGIDVIAVIDRLRSLGCHMPAFFVVSGFDSPVVQQLVCESGALYYFIKPFDADVLAQRVASLLNIPEVRPAPSKGEAAVADELIKYGIPANLNGFRYLKHCVLLGVANESRLRSVTKLLYPEAARELGVSPGSLERAVRNAIEIAWSRGIQREALLAVSPDRGKPTNSEFIAFLCEQIKNSRFQNKQAK